MLEEIPFCVSLSDYIDKREKYTENDASLIIATVLKSLSFIHEKGHVHGDIRLDNIYLDSTGTLGELKLFGIAPGTEMKSTRFGAVQYESPNDPNNSDSKTD